MCVIVLYSRNPPVFSILGAMPREARGSVLLAEEHLHRVPAEERRHRCLARTPRDPGGPSPAWPGMHHVHRRPSGAAVSTGSARRSVVYPQNHVGRGWGIRNGTMGTVRLPKIPVLTFSRLLCRRSLGRQGALAPALHARARCTWQQPTAAAHPREHAVRQRQHHGPGGRGPSFTHKTM